MMEVSRSPIILSHSGCRAVHDHPRNIDDARIKKLAAAGGTIQVNSYNNYLIDVPPDPKRDKARGALYGKLENLSNMTPAEAAGAMREVAAGMKALDAKYPQPRATFETYMSHVTHALDLVGPNMSASAPTGTAAAASPAWKTWRRSPKSPNAWSSWVIPRHNSPASGRQCAARAEAAHEARKV